MGKIDNKQLELWTARVHRLLEGENADIQWNKFIPDPDNPDQLRQVDVTIQKDDVITHVECRAHKTPQDVKWIEELIGRRLSLAAHSMIAVSSSGFTVGARKKAQRYGILLRTLSELSDQEIQSWTNRAIISMRWLRIGKLRIELEFGLRSKGLVNIDDVELEIRNGNLFRTVLDLISSNIDTDADDGVVFGGELRASLDLVVAGQNAHGVTCEFEVDIYTEELRVPIVLSYSDLDGDSASTVATIERTETQGIELLQAEDSINLIIDLSSVEPPANCHMIGPGLKYDSPMTLKSLQVLNMVRPPIFLDELQVGTWFKHPGLRTK